MSEVETGKRKKRALFFSCLLTLPPVTSTPSASRCKLSKAIHVVVFFTSIQSAILLELAFHFINCGVSCYIEDELKRPKWQPLESASYSEKACKNDGLTDCYP